MTGWVSYATIGIEGQSNPCLALRLEVGYELYPGVILPVYAVARQYGLWV